MSNFRGGNFGSSYFSDGKMGLNSYSKNFGYGCKSPTYEDGHNFGQVQFILENERKKFKEARQKFEYDIDSQRKLRIQFQNKLIKLKDQFSRKQIHISQLQFKVNNLLHQNQDLTVENERMKIQLNRLQDAYGGRIHQLETKLSIQGKNFEQTTQQYNSQFQKFRKQGQQYIEQLTFDYQRKIKNLQEKYKLSQNTKKQLALESKKLNDILISNKLTFEEEVRDLKNRAREDQVKKTQSITKSYDQKLKMLDQNKQNIIRKNTQLLKILQQKDRQLQELQAQKDQQISRLQQQLTDTAGQLNHLTYIITKLKSQLSQKQSLLSHSNAGSQSQLIGLRQQLDSKKQQINQLSSANRDLRLMLKTTESDSEAKCRELRERIRVLDGEVLRYRGEYDRICEALRSKINDTIVAVAGKR